MPRVLFVSHKRPFSPRSGGEQRTALLWDALNEVADVELLLVDPVGAIESSELAEIHQKVPVAGVFRPRTPPLPAPAAWLRTHMREFWFVRSPLFGRLRAQYRPTKDRLSAYSALLDRGKYDLVVGRYLRPTAWAGALACERAPVLLDVDDLDTDVYESMLRAPGARLLDRLQARVALPPLRRIMEQNISRADGIWVTNGVDYNRVNHECCHILPNIPYFPSGFPSRVPYPPTRSAQILLFVGSLDYTVNLRGLEVFVSNVWPAIHRAVPGARFRVVGVGLSSRLRDRLHRVDGVEPVGFVESLESEYARASAVVVPVFDGGGTKIKVAEASAYGRPVIMTRHAYRGYGRILEHGTSAWVADSLEDMRLGATRLLGNRTVAKRMGARAYAATSRHLAYSTFAERVRTTVAGFLFPASSGENR